MGGHLSEAKVELVESVYRAVNDGDLPAFLALMHPEVELTTSGVYPDFDATYNGHVGAVDYWAAAREIWIHSRSRSDGATSSAIRFLCWSVSTWRVATESWPSTTGVTCSRSKASSSDACARM